MQKVQNQQVQSKFETRPRSSDLANNPNWSSQKNRPNKHEEKRFGSGHMQLLFREVSSKTESFYAVVERVSVWVCSLHETCFQLKPQRVWMRTCSVQGMQGFMGGECPQFLCLKVCVVIHSPCLWLLWLWLLLLAVCVQCVYGEIQAGKVMRAWTWQFRDIMKKNKAKKKVRQIFGSLPFGDPDNKAYTF